MQSLYGKQLPCSIAFCILEEKHKEQDERSSRQRSRRNATEEKDNRSMQPERKINKFNGKVRDMSQYPNVQLILEHFPGRVIIEDTYEEKIT